MHYTALIRNWFLTAVTVLSFTFQVGATELVIESPGFPSEGFKELRQASLIQQTIDSPESTAQDIVAAARADYARLVAALYEQGYYSVAISIKVDGQEAANLSPLQAPTTVQSVRVDIDPGEPFTFSKASVDPLAQPSDKPEGFAKGERANSSKIQKAAQSAVEGWREVGHPKADIVGQSIIADHRNATLSAEIHVDPGPLLSFGQLEIATPSSVRDSRLRAIAGLPTGETFTAAELERATKRLQRTGVFRSVVLKEADEIGPNDTLDIIANVEDTKPRRIGFGAELSSLEGLTLSSFWMHRNLLGGAEKLRLEGEVGGIGGDSGGIDYRFSARLDRPATFNSDTDLFLLAKIEELNEPDYRERNVQVGGGIKHLFNEDLTGELGIAYQFTDIDDDFGSRQLEHLLFPGSLTFDKRDEPLDATKGFFAELGLTPFLGLDSASGTGGRIFFDARAYRSFGAEGDTILAFRGQVGSILGAGVTEVPTEMLFYSGGAGTVRGQPYQSLSVTLPDGRTSGGRSFLALSGEVRQALWGPWEVVGFADAGFVGADRFGQENGDWHSGGGFGVRYDTGFGPIRVDIATPLDGDAGKNVEFYIGIGQAF